MKQKIAVLGPGSWGTALAQVLSENGHEVTIWGNNPAQIDEINTYHTNRHYLPDLKLPENILGRKKSRRGDPRGGCCLVCSTNQSDSCRGTRIH